MFNPDKIKRYRQLTDKERGKLTLDELHELVTLLATWECEDQDRDELAEFFQDTRIRELSTQFDQLEEVIEAFGEMLPLVVGDHVRIRQAGGKLGHTLWRIMEILPGCGCMIKEHDTENAPQRFDVSLLQRVKE